MVGDFKGTPVESVESRAKLEVEGSGCEAVKVARSKSMPGPKSWL